MRINTLYFSATDTTKKVVTGIRTELAANTGNEDGLNIDFTLPDKRKVPSTFNTEDIVIGWVPVYAGRVPNVLVNYLKSINGNGALAVAVVVYGNRNYDDALVELQDILEETGFKVIAAGAFIGEHSFSRSLAKDRPDEQDMVIVKNFAKQIGEKIRGRHQTKDVVIKGSRPYSKHYIPKNEKGEPADIRKVTPKTNSSCTDCKRCASLCPMGSIMYEDVATVTGICIKCGACIKKCPVQAKYYDDRNYLWHKEELEIKFAARREPELFI